MPRIIAAIVFAVIFSSCGNKSTSDLAVFKTLNIALNQSIIAISKSNEKIYHAIDDRAKNPTTIQYGAIWQPKAILIKDISLRTINYINTLINDLKVEAGLRMEESKGVMREVFKEDDMDAVRNLLFTKAKGIELEGKLQKYRQEMLAIDTEFVGEFSMQIIDVADSNYKNGFAKNYFQNIPAIAAVAVLRRFESAVNISENNFITFCLNKMNPLVIRDDFPVPLISQSSSYVKAGNEIKITAGIGIFSTDMQPKVTIGNQTMQPSNQGVVIYKFRAKGKAGKNILPVKMEFYKYDGTKETFERNIEYTIVE